jgi:hypothetical protein
MIGKTSIDQIHHSFFFVFRRLFPQQLSDVSEYLDNKLTEITSTCLQSPSGK